MVLFLDILGFKDKIRESASSDRLTNSIKITAGNVTAEAELNNTQTADAIW